MIKEKQNRLEFLKNTAGAISALSILSSLPTSLFANHLSNTSTNMGVNAAGRIRFSVIGINHGHINAIIDRIVNAGGILESFYAAEEDLADAFAKEYPAAKRARSAQEVYENKSIQLIASAAIPADRAAIGIAAMQHQKDFLVDKPAVISLEQLAEVKKVQQSSGRIFAIMYGRFENRGSLQAGELIEAGAIGKVIQTIAFAPHRTNPLNRPDWFWNTKHYGGIINDLGSHQFEEFLYFTGSTKAEIVAAQVANVSHDSSPNFEDFGDAMVTGDKGTGYMRLDWFTPDGLQSWGDDRVTILGTEGYIEVRKNIDIAGRVGGNHLILVDKKETRYIDCNNYPLSFGAKLLEDIVNRTSTCINQAQCFLATELSLLAQQKARKITLDI